MNAIDLFVAFVALVLGFRGLRRGFLRSLFGFAGWVGGFLGGILLMYPLGPPLAERLSLEVAVGALIVFLTVFAVSYVVFSAVGFLLSKVAEATFLGPLDRFAGLVLGVAEGMALCAFVFFVLHAGRTSPAISSRLESSFLGRELGKRAEEVIGVVRSRATGTKPPASTFDDDDAAEDRREGSPKVKD